MDITLIQALTNFFQAVDTPLGVAALTIIGLVILPRIGYVRRYFGQRESYAELKPILTRMAGFMEKMGTNDLVHLQDDISRLGSNFADFRTRDFSAHNIQAAHIEEKAEEIWDKVKSL